MATMWDSQSRENEVLQKETFHGIKSILDRKVKNAQSVILIIKNIKSFNHQVLNDLIHLVKKYRANYGCNLCLMLGV